MVRFFALLRIKPHAPPPCGSPSIPLSFNLAVLPRRVSVSCSTGKRKPLTLSTHRLRRGLPGYLILFDPHAFAHQRQLQTRKSPSPLVFLHILRISPLHMEFPFLFCTQVFQSNDPPRLSRAFTSDLKPPTRAYAHIPDNACHLRITAAAGM